MSSPRAIQVEEIPLWNVLIDVTIIALSLSSTMIFVKNVKAFKGGFFCDDDTIRYPYKSSTISIGQLYAVAVLLPVITMSAVELWIQHRQKLKRNVLLAGWMVPEWIFRLVRQILLFGYGLGAVEIMVNVGKFTVGRLRPHFLDTCKPNMYLENRIRWSERAVVAKTAFETLIIMSAWYTALTRISDAKHHWQDVAAGSLMGTVGALIWVWRILRVQPESDSGAADGNNSASNTNTYVFSADESSPKRKI
ncbi:Putative phosphatidate phosphatase [Gryllus bimaculatus]|nr:Putative phosphatidate phosphatase [Gryllus bimaculatus]